MLLPSSLRQLLGRTLSVAGLVIVIGAAFLFFTLGPSQAASKIKALWAGNNAVSPFFTGTVALSASSYSVNESTGSISITVNRTGDTSGTASVLYATSNGTATNQADYGGVSGTVSFAAGETSKSFTIYVINDNSIEANETVNISLSSPTDATLGSPSAATLTINDNETKPTISIDSISVFEGLTGTFTVSLSAPSNESVTVNYATANGTATGADYFSTSGTLTFPAGSTEQTVSVFTFGDDLVEGGEVFNLNLSSPANATIATSSGSCGIINRVAGGFGSVEIDFTIDRFVVDEGAATATVTVIRSGDVNSGVPYSVDYTTSAGTASSSSDYTNTSGTVSFGFGEASASFTVPITSDTLDEPVESINLSLSNPTSDSVLGDQATAVLNIIDNDNPPNLSINDVTVTEGNSGTVTATYTVSLSAASSRTVTVSYATANITATAGSDYTAASGTLTFDPGVITRTFTVTSSGDTTFEPTETYAVNLSNQTNANISDGQGIGTITNDDLQALSINDVTLTEGNSGTTNAIFSVTLTGGSNQTITVNYATANGTAAAGSDYTSTSGTLTFPVGTTSRTITVPVTGEFAIEGNETFFVNLSGAVNATITDSQGIGTINNDDANGELKFTASSFAVDESVSGGLATITVTRANGVTGAVSVSYATSNGSAKSTSDYTSASGTLNFAEGETGPKSFTIAITDDALNEDNETVNLILSSPTGGATLGNPSTSSLIINNNDPLPSFSITDATVTEGNSGSLNAVFTVSLNTASGRTTTVNVATTDGSAVAATNDYLAISGTLSFPEGTTSQTVIVPVNGDTIVEANETYSVNLSSAVNAVIGDSQGAGTITNDDSGLPSISINDVTITEGNSGTTTMNFTVSLSVAVAQIVTVNYTTVNNTALAGSDFVGAVGTLTIPANTATQTLGITINGDTLNEINESFSITLSNPINAIFLDDKGVGTINNDDGVPNLSINDVSIAEGDGGITNLIFTVSLGAVSGQNVTVNYTTADGTATTANNDYVANSGTLTIPAGLISKPLTIVVNGDTSIEPNETFTVNLSSPVNASISDSQGIGTINNDELLPTLNISDAAVIEGRTLNEGVTVTGGEIVFTVTLSDPVEVPVTVDYAFQSGTATGGGVDYGVSATSGTLTFSPGTTILTIGAAIVHDNTVEGDETFLATLSNATNATIADNQAVATIYDDDSSLEPAGINFEQNSYVVDEVSQTVTVKVIRPNTTIDPVTVDYAVTGGSAGVNDYSVSSGSITFDNFELEKTISITINADAKSEAHETIVLTLQAPFGGICCNHVIGDVSSTTVTIKDNDPRPRLSINDISLFEGNSGTTSAVFTISLVNDANQVIETGQTVTFNYITAPNSAASGVDYTATSGTATIAADTSSTTITVPIIADNIVESDETFFLNLNSPIKAKIADGQGICTIQNDEIAGRIEFSSVNGYQVDEAAGTATITLRRVIGSVGAVSVSYTTSDNTATAGLDYQQTAGTITFGDGDMADKTFTIPIINDTLDENGENLLLTLSNPTGGATVGESVFLLIIDNEEGPTISIGAATPVIEGNSGTAIMTFPITLNRASDRTVKVRYETIDGTAKATDNDYTPTSSEVIFDPGVTAKTVPVIIKGDTNQEADETFEVRLFAPSDATIGTASGIGTILDDEPSSVKFSMSAYEVNENVAGGNATITVIRAGNSGSMVSVSYATSNGTATAGSDYTTSSNTLTFNAGETTKTFTVPIVDDTEVEPNETVNLTLNNPVNAMLITPSTATLTIKDNDQFASLQFNPGTYTVNEAAGTVTLTVTRSGNTSEVVTVNYSTGGGTATAGSDYTSTSNMLTFNNGDTSKTFTVPILDDMMAEGGETFNVTLSGPSANAQLGSATTATVTINDNESNTEVKFEQPSYTISEGVATLTIKVKRTGNLSGTSSVDYVISNTGVTFPATAGTDYTVAATGTLTFAAGAEEAVITITIVNDALIECDEMFKITLQNPMNANITGTNPVTVTIMEDDVMRE